MARVLYWRVYAILASAVRQRTKISWRSCIKYTLTQGLTSLYNTVMHTTAYITHDDPAPTHKSVVIKSLTSPSHLQ